MKKKIKISLFVFIVIGVVLLNITYKNKNEVTKTKRKSQSNLAIMIKEEGASDYAKSKDIPKGNYTLNKKKSYCKNNGVIGNYDNTLGKVSFSFIGTDSCYLYFDYGLPGYITILNNNGGKDAIEAKGTPDFSKIADTNEGMYVADDDLGTSYYFRGAVDNNWVKFGKEGDKDIYWRIIRINGDGSIRMIYSGTTDPKKESSVTGSNGVYMTGTGTQINATTYAFNSSYNKAEYVGYMYTLGQQHGNSTDSKIKTTIDNWYKTTTLETDSKTKSLVADQIFCNDRSAGSTQTAAWTSTGATYYYGAYGRLISNKTPILTCPTASDKFTVDTSNGNGALTYPVGLITADEVAMAGGVYGTGNSTYYLYTNQYYWSGSPDYFVSSGVALEFYVNSSGFLFNNPRSNNDRGTRPVISLSSSVKLSGDGTWNNVYTVS